MKIYIFIRKEQGRNSITQYARTMNDFTQNFMAVCWENEGDNFVFSPFSLHSVLAMLTSGSTSNSDTQEQLLNAFGSHRVIKSLEDAYGQFVKSYKNTEVEKNLRFGNRIWTNQQYYPEIEKSYKKKIESLYDAKMLLFTKTNPEKAVNDWVNRTTNGNIDKIIGKRKK